MIRVLDDLRVRVAGACFLSAVVGFAVGNGHTTSHAVENVSQQLGYAKQQAQSLASVAGCQEKRADVAEGDLPAPHGLIPCPTVATGIAKPQAVLAEKK